MLPSLLAAVAVGLLSAGPAQAGWTGASLTWQYYAYGGAYDGGGSPGNCTVSKNSTLCGSFLDYFNIETDKASITFDYSPSGTGETWTKSNLSLSPTIHNGVAINLTSPGTIASVKIDPATNMAGFKAKRISFTANQIQVDWQKLSFDSSTIVKLDIKVVNTAGARAPAFAVAAPARAVSSGHPAHQPTLRDNPPRQ